MFEKVVIVLEIEKRFSKQVKMLDSITFQVDVNHVEVVPINKELSEVRDYNSLHILAVVYRFIIDMY